MDNNYTEISAEELNDEIEELELDDELIEEIEEEETPSYIKMDYSLETAEERVNKVKEIVENTPDEKLTPFYLDRLAKYILDAADKQEKKQKKILTDNRMITVNKRETSFEGLVGRLENGEDGIYGMIANDKNIIFQPKATITEEDKENIPALKSLCEDIKKIEEIAKNARGKRRYAIQKQLIEMRQDQYEIRKAYVKPFKTNNLVKSLPMMDLTDHIYFDVNGFPHNKGYIDLFNKSHISVLLCNYVKLKEDTWDRLGNDTKWLMIDLEELIDTTLKDKYPLYYDILIYKIDGKQNNEIQELLQEKYGTTHSVEYISSLWRNKIPKLIAEKATEQYLEWHYTFKEKGAWKKCSRCGQIKLAHNQFFSKNKTSRDGYYSICKCCRNKKETE